MILTVSRMRLVRLSRTKIRDPTCLPVTSPFVGWLIRNSQTSIMMWFMSSRWMVTNWFRDSKTSSMRWYPIQSFVWHYIKENFGSKGWLEIAVSQVVGNVPLSDQRVWLRRNLLEIVVKDLFNCISAGDTANKHLHEQKRNDHFNLLIINMIIYYIY